MGNWDNRRKEWRRRQLAQATRQHDFRPSWAIIHEAIQRHDERLRLFGYVLLQSGERIGIDEALRRLRLSDRPGGISKEQIREWHPPEVYHDVLDSIGEIDCTGTYRALRLFPGVVLVDPKRRHVDPMLMV